MPKLSKLPIIPYRLVAIDGDQVEGGGCFRHTVFGHIYGHLLDAAHEGVTCMEIALNMHREAGLEEIICAIDEMFDEGWICIVGYVNEQPIYALTGQNLSVAV